MLSQLTRLPRQAKLAILLLVDGMIGALAIWSAVTLRASGIPTVALDQVLGLTLFAFFLVPMIGLVFGFYRSVIRFAIPGLSGRVALISLTCGAVIALTTIGVGGAPRRAVAFGAVFALVLFAFQVLSRQAARWFLGDGRAPSGKRIAVYGAGAAGRQLVTLLRKTGDFAPMMFIDDNASLHGRTIEDLLVVGPDEKKLPARLKAQQIHEIFLAIPSLKPGGRREILERLAHFPFKVRIVPGLAEVVSGEQGGSLSDLRDVSIEDLLGRETVAPLSELLDKCVKGKCVLVTGGGGSIGAELCRQILALNPERLVILEHSEYALYRIEQELLAARSKSGCNTQFEFVLGSVADRGKVADVFARWQVDTVYHAAAYKHVPIVEVNPLEGFRNNVLGTWYLAQAAAAANVSHFVLISSDKAVRPTNVMGATKRMAELVLQVQSEKHTGTTFSVVRFGNVLASSGSVVPLFRAQIEAGGPITLTHSEVTRYFMTIEEAVQLVIQAGAMARSGEIFVLDMGSPVKIRDLAVRMIRLSGRSVRDPENPKGDIAIEVIGLRPGEKLFEELLISGQAIGTTHPRICQVREPSAEAGAFERELDELEQAFTRSVAAMNIRQVLAKWVAGYAGDVEVSSAGLRMPPSAPVIALSSRKA